MKVKPVETDPFHFFKKAFLFLCAIGLILLVCYAGYRGFRKWEQTRLVAQAGRMLEEGDLRNAALTAQRVLQKNAVNVPANRILAEVADQWRSPNALFWRIRAANLSPDSVEDKLALARTALQFNRSPIAQKALHDVPEAERQNPEFHKLTAELEVKNGNWDKAEEAWVVVHDMDGGDMESGIALASARLRSKDVEKSDAARQFLRESSDNPLHGADALRVLVTERETPLTAAEILGMATKLHTHPEASFTDHLVALQIHKGADSEAFSAMLESDKQLAQDNPDFLYLLLTWLTGSGDKESALALAVESPAASKIPACMASAGVLAAAADWQQLNERFGDADWGPFEYIRLCYVARAQRELGNEAMARSYFGRATSLAASTVGAPAAILDLLNTWPGWQKEIQSLLWRVVSASPERRWALRALFDHYAKYFDTRGLLRVAEETLKIDANDKGAQNNKVMFHLLTGGEPSAVLGLAETLVESDAKNTAFVSTLAFALHRNGQTKEGLERIETLDADTLMVPQIAAYYGILLAADGQIEKADAFLKLGLTVPLLPEEIVMIREARGEASP